MAAPLSDDVTVSNGNGPISGYSPPGGVEGPGATEPSYASEQQPQQLSEGTGVASTRQEGTPDTYDPDAREEGPLLATAFWVRDPGILFRSAEIVPYGWMSPARKGNALTRLALLVGAALFINRMRGGDMASGITILGTLVAVVLAILMLSHRRDQGYYTTSSSPGGGSAALTAAWARPAAPAGQWLEEADGGGRGPDELAGRTPDRTYFDQDARAYRREIAPVNPTPQSRTDMTWLVGGPVGRSLVTDPLMNATSITK